MKEKNWERVASHVGYEMEGGICSLHLISKIYDTNISHINMLILAKSLLIPARKIKCNPTPSNIK